MFEQTLYIGYSFKAGVGTVSLQSLAPTLIKSVNNCLQDAIRFFFPGFFGVEDKLCR